MTDPSPLKRRKYLALAGSVIATGVTAGCSRRSTDRETTETSRTTPPPSETSTETSTETPTETSSTSTETSTTSHSYDTVLNVVEAGADPTGGEPIDDVLTEIAGDDTKLVFPEGTYLVDGGKDGTLRLTNVENVAFVGEDGATLKAPPDVNGTWLFVRRSRNVTFENVDVDATASNCAPTLQFGVDTGLVVRDVEVVGRGQRAESRSGDGGDASVGNALMPYVQSPNGRGIVQNFVAKTGGRIGEYNQGNGRVGIFVGQKHRGLLRIVDSHLEEFPNNGIYASRTTGVVRVEGGTYRNNDISQVRVGSEGSVVRDATVEVAASRVRSPNESENFLNARGIRIETGSIQTAGASVRNCDVTIRDAPRSNGGVVVAKTGGRFAISDTRIRILEDRVQAINAKKPTGGHHPAPPKPHRGTIERVLVRGDADGEAAIKIVGRPETTLADCTIAESGSRRGIRLVDSSRCLITGGSIATKQEPILATVRDDVAPDECLLRIGSDVEIETAAAEPANASRPDHSPKRTTNGDRATRCITVSEFVDQDDADGVFGVAILAQTSDGVIGMPLTNSSGGA